MKNIWRVISLLPSYKSKVTRAVIFSSLLGWVGVTTPYLFKLIIDNVVASAKTGHATATATLNVELLIGGLAALRLLDLVFDYFQGRLGDRLWVEAAWGVRQRLFEHLVTLSIDYYEQNKVGEIIERVQNGVMDVARWTYNLSQGALVNILSLVFIMGLLWLKLPWVGLIMTVTLPLNIYAAVRRVRRTEPLRRDSRKEAERANGELTETLSHIATVRSFAQEDYKVKRYSDFLATFRVLRLNQFKIEWMSDFWRNLVSMLGVIGSLMIVALGAVNGRYTAGDILLVSLYANQIINSVRPLSRLITETGEVESSAERMTEMLDLKPTLSDAVGAVDLERLESIEFKHVSFKYPGKKRQVIEDVSFKINQGQSLALVGPSGVGKTTVTKLLLRFYAPTSGQILINGQDISKFKQNSIRRLVGSVMQEVALFNDTVEENLRFANPSAKTADIKAAATMAHADVFIEKLSEKYKTLVGERGVKLSGGEKQRVAIARAILRDPQLIILDEATSALDSQSEQFVQDGLAKLMTGRTAVIIAHRLSTVMKADKILVLKDGRVAEQGSHDQLVKRTGYYAKSYGLQVGREVTST